MTLVLQPEVVHLSLKALLAVLALASCNKVSAVDTSCTGYTFGKVMWSTEQQEPELPAYLRPGYVAYSEADLAAGVPFTDGKPYVWMTELDDRLAGITMQGNPSRMRAAFQRLINGGPMSIAFLGGSVTYGAKFCTEGMTIPRWTELILKKLLPDNLRDRVTVRNSGIPGVPSAHFEICLSDHCPADVDVVVLEFAVNDINGFEQPPPWEHNEQRHAFERLIRKVLQLKNRPAVILLNHAMTKDLGPLENMQPEFHHPWSPSIWPWAGVEHEFYILATYYRVPSLSMRGAAIHKMNQGFGGYWLNETRSYHWNASSGHFYPNTADDQPLEPNNGKAFYMDPVHPDGNTGMRVHGELVAHHLLDAAASVFAVPVSASEMAKINASLPEPAFIHNFERLSADCTGGQAMEKIVTADAGWQDTDEGRKKWGFVSNTPGSTLRIHLNTTLNPNLALDAQQRPRKVEMTIEHLKSYAHMGVAKVECESSCQCDQSFLEGYNPGRVSLLHEHRFIVTQGGLCTILITVMPETHSPDGGKKVKILGVGFNPLL